MEAPGNQVLGSGRILFDRFADGSTDASGVYRYFGNSTAFALNQSQETLDHFDADNGIKQKDLSVQLSADTGGTITLDDISAENLAMWFLGDVEQKTVVMAAGQTHNVTDVVLGSMIVLGATGIGATPAGVGNVTAVQITSGGDTISAVGNWDVDLSAGIVTISPDAVDITEGDDLVITYTQSATTSAYIISKNKSIYGRLFFHSKNAQGKKRDGMFPYVKLSPDGDYNLKGDDWQTMTFSVEVLKLGNLERVYWRTRA
jgi:hypothetical protein